MTCSIRSSSLMEAVRLSRLLSSRSRCFRTYWMVVRMPVRGFLISWAMPAEMVPSESRRRAS